MQIAGSVAHDFNNLLQVITGGIGLVQAALQTNESGVAGNLDKAMQAAKAAADITKALLLYMGHSHIELKTTDLKEIARKYSTLLHGSSSWLHLSLTEKTLSIYVWPPMYQTQF
ncbi:MAG: hypothetical protein OEV17_06025 [Nitrospira sp.]|nr:hypothetical protein [Nitrospira sp.]